MIAPGGHPARWHRATSIPLLCLTLLSAGCSSANATTTPSAIPWVTGLGGSVTVGIDQSPTGCNPNSLSGNTWANHVVLEPVLPSAFVVSPSGQPIYDSAVITQAEVQSLAPQTVVYSINPRAVWSDGVPITEADFLYAWQQQRGDPAVPGETPNQMASTLGYRDIQSVAPTNGGRTVTVIFRTPFADWKMLFNDLLPAHIMEKVGWNPTCSTVDPAIDLSGGPFEIAKVVPGKQVVLSRNPRWWGQKADLDRLVIQIGSGARQLTHWLTDGTAQAVLPSSFGAQFLETVGSRPGLNSAEPMSATFLQLDFSATSATTGDLQVRQAVSHAVDRQAVVNAVVGWANSNIVPSASHLYSQGQGAYPGPATPTLQMLGLPTYTPPASPRAPTPSRPFPLVSDPASVARLLTAAGYTRPPGSGWVEPNGKPFVLTMAVDAGDSWALLASGMLADQLMDQGIGVTTRDSPDAPATGMALASGAADIAIIPLQSSPYPTQAIAWYTTLLGPPGVDGSQDWMNYNDPALNATLTNAAQQLNPVKASPLYAQADLALWNSMIALPLFAEPTTLAWSNYVGGIGPNPYGSGLLWFPQTWGLRVPPDSPHTAP